MQGGDSAAPQDETHRWAQKVGSQIFDSQRWNPRTPHAGCRAVEKELRAVGIRQAKISDVSKGGHHEGWIVCSRFRRLVMKVARRQLHSVRDPAWRRAPLQSEI